MTEISLSTMWSLKYKSMAGFVRKAREFGFTHLELNASLTPEKLDELLAIEGLPISSVHAPCPNARNREGVEANALSLSALNEDERREAVDFTKATIDLAQRVGAKFVVVHAGWVVMNPGLEHEMRRLYEQGQASSDEFNSIKAKLMAAREFFACPHLEAAKESLLDLAGYARSRGVRIGLENRSDYHEIPTIDEMLDILGELPPEAAGYWHDVGHAEIQSRLGFTPHEDWFAALSDRMLGVHLHDIRGLSDHQAPGIGEQDWDMIAANIPEAAVRVCEIVQWNKVKDARHAVPFLRGKGIVRGST